MTGRARSYLHRGTPRFSSACIVLCGKDKGDESCKALKYLKKYARIGDFEQFCMTFGSVCAFPFRFFFVPLPRKMKFSSLLPLWGKS